jgi:hypothetical protein
MNTTGNGNGNFQKRSRRRQENLMHRINMDRLAKTSASPQPKSMIVRQPRHSHARPAPHPTDAPAGAANGISFDMRHIPISISRPDMPDVSHSSPAPVRQLIQRKPTLGPENDIYEREADKTALRLLPHFKRAVASSQGAPSADGKAMQSLAAPSAERIQGLKGIAAGTQPVTNAVESGIQRAQNGGSPLPAAIRAPMEQALHTDLHSVRIHTGGPAAHLNRSVQAQAFTIGENIFFAQGAYGPTRTDGQQLLAHELTHVVQQRTDPGASPQAGQQPAADQLPAPLIQRGKEDKKKETKQRKREREEKEEKLAVSMKESGSRPSREEREKQKKIHKKLEDINAELGRMDPESRTRASFKKRAALKQEEEQVKTSGTSSGAFRKTRQPPNFSQDIHGRRLWQLGAKGAIRPNWGGVDDELFEEHEKKGVDASGQPYHRENKGRDEYLVDGEYLPRKRDRRKGSKEDYIDIDHNGEEWRQYITRKVEPKNVLVKDEDGAEHAIEAYLWHDVEEAYRAKKNLRLMSKSKNRSKGGSKEFDTTVQKYRDDLDKEEVREQMEREREREAGEGSEGSGGEMEIDEDE